MPASPSSPACVRLHERTDLLKVLRSESAGNDYLVALSSYMSAAGNETRMRILYVLWRADHLCVCDLADIFGISQPAVSRHLKILREKALVSTTREAQTIYYSICSDNAFAQGLTGLFEQKELRSIELSV
jgi:ArsR family transcriptional regulator, lead/cadmium/zinc/bismuth-responsive transcriptional repressor